MTDQLTKSPTQFAQRKIAFWKRKHERRVGACAKQGISVDPERWDLAIKVIWDVGRNTHTHTHTYSRLVRQM